MDILPLLYIHYCTPYSVYRLLYIIPNFFLVHVYLGLVEGQRPAPQVHPGVMLKDLLLATLSEIYKSLCFNIDESSTERNSFDAPFSYIQKNFFLLVEIGC